LKSDFVASCSNFVARITPALTLHAIANFAIANFAIAISYIFFPKSLKIMHDKLLW
jgi:hypothetical protein